MDSSVPLSEEHNSTEMTPINSDSSFAASQSSGDDTDSDDDPELDRWLQRATGLQNFVLENLKHFFLHACLYTEL